MANQCTEGAVTLAATWTLLLHHTPLRPLTYPIDIEGYPGGSLVALESVNPPTAPIQVHYNKDEREAARGRAPSSFSVDLMTCTPSLYGLNLRGMPLS